MIKLSDNFNLPQCLSNRKKNLDYDMFLKYFSLEVQNNINYILNSGLYIPQEIIDHRIFLNLLGADCE
jgi:hypothetical protein